MSSSNRSISINPNEQDLLFELYPELKDNFSKVIRSLIFEAYPIHSILRDPKGKELARMQREIKNLKCKKQDLEDKIKFEEAKFNGLREAKEC